jgi:hypothetical protein
MIIGANGSNILKVLVTAPLALAARFKSPRAQGLPRLFFRVQVLFFIHTPFTVKLHNRADLDECPLSQHRDLPGYW